MNLFQDKMWDIKHLLCLAVAGSDLALGPPAEHVYMALLLSGHISGKVWEAGVKPADGCCPSWLCSKSWGHTHGRVVVRVLVVECWMCHELWELLTMSCSSLAHLSILPSTLPRLTDLVSFIFFFYGFHLSLSLLLPASCQVHTDGKQHNVVQTGSPQSECRLSMWHTGVFACRLSSHFLNPGFEWWGKECGLQSQVNLALVFTGCVTLIFNSSGGVISPRQVLRVESILSGWSWMFRSLPLFFSLSLSLSWNLPTL